MDDNAVIPDFDYPQIGVRVELLRWLEAAVPFGISQGTCHCQTLALGRQDPVFQPLLIIRAKLLIHFLRNCPQHILGIPTNANGAGTTSGAPEILTFYFHVGDEIIRALHHGIPTQDSLAGEDGGSRVHVGQFRVVGRIIIKSMALDRSFRGRMRRDILDEFAKLVYIRAQFPKGCQIVVSRLKSHNSIPFTQTLKANGES